MNSSTGKYKTVLCKHFGQNGTCSYGDKCQFAHGFQELKNSNEITSMTNDNNSSNNNNNNNNNSNSNNNNNNNNNNKNKTKTAPNPSNFKIVKCKNWETSGNCKYGSVCTFAHGDTELRTKSENTQQITENAVMMDTGFMPNTMNPYLMNDPNMFYQMVMQQQMMNNMGTNPNSNTGNNNYMDMYNMNNMGYGNTGIPNNLNSGEGVNLNDNNNMFFGGMGGYGDMSNMNPNLNDNNSNSNMFMGGKP